MMQGLSAAKTGMIGQQYRIDTIANNIANINTVGFRASSVRFADTLYTTMQDPAQGGGDLQLGTGVMVSSTKNSFLPGPLIATSEALDFAIDGDGFFTVQNGDETLYTRNGAFDISIEGETQYLITQQGYYVLDANGARITIPQSQSGNLTVGPDGSLCMDGAAPFAQLGLARFANNEGLLACGGGCYAATDASGEALTDEITATIRQGSLEESNVNLVLEMTQLIRAQKCYSLAARVVNMLDEMQKTANDMRR
jgi:flagellar basal-body rod protein FlgG